MRTVTLAALVIVAVGGCRSPGAGDPEPSGDADSDGRGGGATEVAAEDADRTVVETDSQSGATRTSAPPQPTRVVAKAAGSIDEIVTTPTRWLASRATAWAQR